MMVIGISIRGRADVLTAIFLLSYTYGLLSVGKLPNLTFAARLIDIADYYNSIISMYVFLDEWTVLVDRLHLFWKRSNSVFRA